MNWNMIVCALALGVSAGAYAVGPKDVTQGRKRMSAAEQRQLFEAKTGGFVSNVATRHGKIVFLDTQSQLSSTNILAVIDRFRKSRTGDYDFTVEHGEIPPCSEAGCGFEAAKKKQGADILVAIVSDPVKPTFLVAPEEGFAVVNVAKLARDLKGDAVSKFIEGRYRKELIRAVCLAAGTPCSQFKANPFTAVTVRDLDDCKEVVPIDVLQRAQAALKARNVLPARVTTYDTACQEGWAPQPTNEIQKAIWDKVHEIPDKPLKIEFDPAAQKGKVTK